LASRIGRAVEINTVTHYLFQLYNRQHVFKESGSVMKNMPAVKTLAIILVMFVKYLAQKAVESMALLFC